MKILYESRILTSSTIAEIVFDLTKLSKVLRMPIEHQIPYTLESNSYSKVS